LTLIVAATQRKTLLFPGWTKAPVTHTDNARSVIESSLRLPESTDHPLLYPRNIWEVTMETWAGSLITHTVLVVAKDPESTTMKPM
jgi:hypothetical protein